MVGALECFFDELTSDNIDRHIQQNIEKFVFCVPAERILATGQPLAALLRRDIRSTEKRRGATPLLFSEVGSLPEDLAVRRDVAA